MKNKKERVGMSSYIIDINKYLKLQRKMNKKAGLIKIMIWVLLALLVFFVLRAVFRGGVFS